MKYYLAFIVLVFIGCSETKVSKTEDNPTEQFIDSY